MDEIYGILASLHAPRVHEALFFGGGCLVSSISIYYNLRFKCMFDYIIHLRITDTMFVMRLASKNEHIHTRIYNFNFFSLFNF